MQKCRNAEIVVTIFVDKFVSRTAGLAWLWELQGAQIGNAELPDWSMMIARLCLARVAAR
jgi:hypothetical protein